ncbi:hypothetical protein LAZ67_5003957 [Cordylochernes scorpioides]|uniref:GIY-YIG domain-containing protein n=1 Tax=Cordylochernes scorpioides TaxID=51811 RepID=A0ABY6KHY1_9ARAC|nr:hypothetical protein LAZ67_5003957 [Cordylochernes scorpioides]
MDHQDTLFLKNFEITTIFKNAPSLKNKVRNHITKQKEEIGNAKDIVYRIPCKGCNVSYIGETGRFLETRLKEHKSWKYAKERVAIVEYGLQSGHQPDWDNTSTIYRGITDRVKLQNSEIELRHQRKLEFWHVKYGFPLRTRSPSEDTIVNLTDIVFSDKQISLLEKGLSFRLPNEPDLLYTISCIESSLQHQSHTDKHHIRSTIANKLLAAYKSSSSRSSSVKSDLASLKALKSHHDILITKSDKGSQVVVLKVDDYKKKMSDILSDSDTFQEISPERVCAISDAYKSSLRLLRRNECITPDQFQQFTSNLSRVPYIYGLPKTHKPSVPLRPIVAYHLSPALPLAKYLSSLLKPLVKTHNLYSVQDPSEFFTRLKNVSQPRGLTMSTFDVTSLFLCLPHSLIIDGLEQLLSSSTLPSNNQKTILDLFTICLDMNALEFNGCFFVQMRGSPMGSPLSTIAAEIVMSNLDRWLVSHNHLGIEMWSRYVDDIFCLHRDTDHLPILTVLNSYHHDLRFTHNPSCFNCIPFLDVLVINTNGTFQTTVFRKPNFTPSYLHFLSHAPVSHKITTVKTLSKRVYTHYSLALFRTIEKRTVYTHLLSAGYPHNFIDRHFYVPNHKKVTPPLYKNVCVLPFSTTNSDIALFLRKFGIRTFFKNSPSLEASLRHPITKSSIKLNPLSLNNGIYKISCNDCEQCYIGETGRTIATRIREHNRNIRSKDRKSLIFQHMADFDHSFNLDDTISVYRDIGNKYQRLVLEALVSNCTPSFNRKIDLPPQYTIFYGLTRWVFIVIYGSIFISVFCLQI